MDTKTCTKCGKHKALDSFGVRSQLKDGLESACKKCLSEYKRLADERPHNVDRRKAYAKSERGREIGRVCSLAWEKKNPKKKRSSYLVKKAINSGLIVKPKHCEVCRISGNLNAHHDNYDNPIDVRWLCPLCHSRWHQANGPGRNGENQPVEKNQ